MSRLDMATSVVLSIKALIPWPEPPPEIETLMSEFFFMKFSEIFCIAGNTVVEPFTTTVPALAATEAKPTAEANNTEIKVRFIFNLPL